MNLFEQRKPANMETMKKAPKIKEIPIGFKASGCRENIITSTKRSQDSSSNSSSSSGDEDQPTASAFRSNRTVKKGMMTGSANNSANKHRQQTNERK